MKIKDNFFSLGNIAPAALAATALIAFLTAIGVNTIPSEDLAEAAMYIEPREITSEAGEEFQVKVVTEANVPVNVFAGEVHFDPEMLFIRSIDYNTSVADLWADMPWYSNGEGTLTFGGGTTQKGGFTGKDEIITINFVSRQAGEGALTLKNPRILLHNGLGNDAELTETDDSIFFVESTEGETPDVSPETDNSSNVRIVDDAPSTDLNDDGEQTVADVSIFMLNMGKDDPRYDFNLDGEVDLKDLNILLGAK